MDIRWAFEGKINYLKKKKRFSIKFFLFFFENLIILINNFCLFNIGELFNKTSKLSQHLRTHNGGKPFKCDICNKTYTQSSALGKKVSHSTQIRKENSHSIHADFS
jgi:hypothetical protein